MKLPIYQIDAFASEVFRGNPAAVCPLDHWLDDACLQAIAAENNLAETAPYDSISILQAMLSNLRCSHLQRQPPRPAVFAPFDRWDLLDFPPLRADSKG